MGLEESYIAGTNRGRFLSNFVEPRELGLVAGEAGMIQLDINLVRIPDVSFISWDRVPGDEFPTEPVPLAGARPGRGGHQPEQHPQGDGGKAPGVL